MKELLLVTICCGLRVEVSHNTHKTPTRLA
jgi:hypothetical protein